MTEKQISEMTPEEAERWLKAHNERLKEVCARLDGIEKEVGAAFDYERELRDAGLIE